MTKQKVEIEVEIPEGWKFVRYGKTADGEHYYDESLGKILVGHSVSGYNWIIVEKDGTIPVHEMKDGEVGVITQWVCNCHVGEVVQRYERVLISLFQGRGGNFPTAISVENPKNRVRLIDREEGLAALCDLTK